MLLAAQPPATKVRIVTRAGKLLADLNVLWRIKLTTLRHPPVRTRFA